MTPTNELSFRRWLYDLGREDENAGCTDRFLPQPDWMSDAEKNAYLSGRTDVRTGASDVPSR